ncbi:putative outer envelope pore protein 24A, chloroplastic-like [Capsicum annuum]|nr:putative outer envelope pore protein 24A, chloroplastic-like [Capsicum annuum]KAF3645751.1 putative outer envelope pore protein 24A, chloroplastic-like [Capsicum annuum]
MASSYKGKFFLFTLLLLFHESWVFSSESVVIEEENKLENLEVEEKFEHVDALAVLKRHQIQLEKLEVLVENLGLLVSKLESRLVDYPKGQILEDKKFVLGEKKKIQDEGSLENKVVDGERVGKVVVTKYSPMWLERFQFISAVRLGSDATSINVLPFRDAEGLSKYVAIGDDRGKVYAFSRNGEVLVDFQTSLSSPITAFVSYLSVYKNESVVVTGHENGGILMHRIWEVVMPDGDDRAALHMETVGKFASPDIEEGGSSILSLEVHHVGRNRYILSTDIGGKLRVFRENGTVYGVTTPKSRPLAFLKQRLLFLTETGAGSLDLRTMKIRESECEGLNNSIAKSYVFDATERSKAYGFTSNGDLIHVLLLGDNMNFKCRVRSRRKLEMAEPLSFQSIKGYLLIANRERVSLYNVSSLHYVRSGGPRLLFSAGHDEIIASFLNSQSLELNDEIRKVIPLVASDQEKLVVLGLGSGYLGVYRSNLPVFKNEFNTMLWTSPVLFFIVFLLFAYYFFAKKKEALTSWGPDDPFTSTSVTSGAPLGSSQGERSYPESSRGDRPYPESSRNADIMDLRGSSLRGPSGRYVSPSRYSGGTTGAYRSNSADTNSRPSSVDPNYRTTSELKFRGSNLETPGFPKRRDSLFVNSQIVDDGK